MSKKLNPFDPAVHPNLFDGHAYALGVIDGSIPNCKYVIGACKRYIKDLNNKNADWVFKADYAERYLKLVQQFEHVIGNWPTKNIVYSPWQKWIWMNIMGFFSKTSGFRRFRVAHIEVPRGNAKSAMASQAVLYFLALDNSQGNQIATVATRREQARIVLDSARAMAEKAKSYLSHNNVVVQSHAILQKSTNSKARALSSDHTGLDGLNDVLAVLDELHAMNRQTFDVVTSGMSKRRDSLTLCITTAGFNEESVGASQSIYAKKVCEGLVEDDQMFCVVYGIDKDDDIFAEATWIKANPGYGVSVDPVTLGAKARKAQETPADLPNFKVKHLNIWLSEANAYYDTARWEVLGNPIVKMEDFRGRPSALGIDIASKIDLCALGYVFVVEDKFAVFDKSFIPKGRVKELRSSLYDNCIGNGYLTATEGEAIDQDYIQGIVEADAKIYKPGDILADPWNAIALLQSLQKKNFNVKEFRMTVSNLSEPMKTLDALIRKGKILHNGSPLLKWTLGNVVGTPDVNDNVFPKKSHDKLKIDPIIAILMALAALLQDAQKKSIYESRPMRFL